MRYLPLLLLLVTGCSSCHPTPGANREVTGRDVCSHLAEIGCPQGPTCELVFDQTQGKFSDFHPHCLMSATERAQAEACKSVQCGTR